MKQEWIDAFFESLYLHKKYVMEAGLKVGDIPLERLFNHDASKFSAEEYPHYARQFHGDKDDPEGFTRAWLHHIHHNPHHWQHWIFPDDYAPTGSNSINGVMEMPETYVREMVADWMGASYGYTGSWDMTEWLAKHLYNGKIILHPRSRIVLGYVLRDLGYNTVMELL